MQAGAPAHVIKGMSRFELLAAIRRVHRDGQTRKEDGARRFLTFRVGTFRRAAASNILHSESIPIFQLRAFRI
jgi:hypothetical protein